MENITEVLWERFDSGIANDVRSQDRKTFARASNFDIYASPHRIIPVRAIADDSASATMQQYDLKDFWFSPSTDRMYALGQNGTGKPKIVYKTDMTAAGWTIPSSSEGAGTRIPGSFIEWAGSLWGFQGSNQIWSSIPGTSFTGTVASTSTTIVNVAQSVISPTDNNMYMFYYSTSDAQSHVIRVSSAGAVTVDVLPLPASFRITSACAHGSFIAMSLCQGTASGKSIVIIWDPTESNFSEIVNFGEGEIKVLESLEGNLVAIMDSFSTSYWAPTVGQLIIRMWGGGGVKTVYFLRLSRPGAGTNLILYKKLLKDNRIFFIATLTPHDTTALPGIWAFGRSSEGSEYALSLAVYDSTISTTNGWQGFGAVGDFFVGTVNADGTVMRSGDQNSSFAEAIYDTIKYNGNDIKQKKKVQSVFVTYPPLPTAGQVVLQYRKDEETSWTTIFTETTDNQIKTEIGTGNVTLPEFHEIQFRGKSTGGAEISSIGLRHYPLGSAARPE